MMIRPVFARGKQQEQSLTQAATAPTNQLYTADASTNFSVGDLILISESDGSELEFLGSVTATTPTYLTTSLSLAADKAATAKLWRPSASFVWPATPSLPLEKDHSTGIVTARSLGGTLFSARVADPRRVDRLEVERMRVADFESLRAWVATSLDDGLLDFSYVDEGGEVSRARLMAPEFLQRQDDEQLTSLAVEIAVLAEGEYV
jgi:hypothetical protein